MLITIGAFDGFHKGHAELLDFCRKNSVNDNWGVVSFSPHPSEFLHKLNHSLFTLEERELIRQVLGIRNMFILSFDDALRDLSPGEFWELLRKKFNVDGLVMGSDFHFGYNRSGSAEFLANLAKSDGLTKIFILDLLSKNNYSSSNVRKKVLAGDVDAAKNVLGYPFFMMSKIIHGNERGRTMRFPTANLYLDNNRTIPAYGVYSSAVLVNHEWHCGALSIGNNPTFSDVNETRAEVHILDFDGDIYGEILPVFLLGRVRGIIAFASKSELVSQIEHDIDSCREIYSNVMKDLATRKFLERAEKVYHTKNLTPEIIRLV